MKRVCQITLSYRGPNGKALVTFTRDGNIWRCYQATPSSERRLRKVIQKQILESRPVTLWPWVGGWLYSVEYTPALRRACTYAYRVLTGEAWDLIVDLCQDKAWEASELLQLVREMMAPSEARAREYGLLPPSMEKTLHRYYERATGLGDQIASQAQ